MSDPYVYPGTNTLINHFGVKKADKLQELESAFFRKAMDEPFPDGSFDYKHLKAIHSHLFGELYPWAGNERTVDIAKENSFFAHTQHISKELNKLFSKLEKEDHLKGLKKEAFCEKLSHYFNEMNAAHPFREGNGRTQRAFCKALASQAGYDLDWKQVDRKTYLKASIDGFKGDEQSMAMVFKKIIEPKEKEQTIDKHSKHINNDAQAFFNQLKARHPAVSDFEKLFQTRQKASGYHAEKLDKYLTGKASDILKNKGLSYEIKNNLPKLFKQINFKSREQSHGLER